MKFIKNFLFFLAWNGEKEITGDCFSLHPQQFELETPSAFVDFFISTALYFINSFSHLEDLGGRDETQIL